MALRIALSGFVVLVVAMGIGRFAFTPQVPLMIAAGQLTLTSAGLVAAMNYLGYLVGAWDAMRAHRFVETRLWLGITGAVALTLLSAAAENAVVHGLLRFVIGCMSGWSMVLIAAWTNERLGQLGKPGLSAAVFAGPGAGIALSGLLAVYIQAKSLSAGAAWQIYGVLALVLTADLKRLVWSYSLAGFGYILPATFLSQMAAVRFPGSLFAQFVWPIFGIAAVVGIALSILLRHTSTANRRLAIVLWLQGAGVLAAWLLPGIGGLLTGGLLVGGGFLCAVQLSLLYGRELAPNHTRYMAGLLTTGYAIGQLIGPMTSALSTWLTHRLEPALGLAGIALFVGGALVWNRHAERQQQLQ
ncbi:YbfB/YjiJ family MFS transporter [Enterobacter sp. ECC-249]|uniref:YbfB/YjiJ family MFS transporter n=1 Tax=Enterobacter sp. ECC-249 TaxID=3116481 RepID=UPI0037549D85